MGTKVQSKSYLPIYHSMRDLNEDSNSCSWPLFYGDKTLTNGQYYNGFLPRAIADSYLGYDKDAVKQKMLEHEAIFKNQVYELHRLYRIQRDLMDEIRRKELHTNRMPVDPSLSPSHLASQITPENARKWHIPSFTTVNSVSAGPSSSGADDIHSPLTSMKGNRTQPGPSPYQGGGSSKDFDVLDSRPTKVRKKMIDLQLPADEYIDTEDGEQFRDDKVSGLSSYLPSRDHKIILESGVKMFLGGGGKIGCQGDASRSDSGIRSTNTLADLNEPIQVEETNASGYVDLERISCHGEILGQEQFAKPKSQFLGFPKEYSLNSNHGSNNRNVNNPHLGTNGNGGGWFSHVLEAGHISKLQSVSQGFQLEKLPISSQPTQVLRNRANELTTFSLTDQNKVDPWRKKTVCSLETSERSHEMSSNNHLDPIVASHVSSLFSVAPSSNLTKTWSHSVSSWEKPSGGLSQKSITVQTLPCLNSSAAWSKNSQSSAQSHGIFGDRWHFNSNSSSNPRFGSELPHQNGVYHGSSSASKDLPICFPSLSYDYLNCSKDHNVASAHFISHGFPNLKDSNCMEVKSAKEVNLNVVLSSSSSRKAVPQQGLEIIGRERKHDDQLAVFPWFGAKPSCKNDATRSSGRDLNMGEFSFFRSSSNQFSKNESGMDPIHNFMSNVKSVPGSHDVEAKRIEAGDCSKNSKLLGFPIFEKPRISKNESYSLTSSCESLPHRSEGEDTENNRKNIVLDINLPCDPSVHDSGKQIVVETLVDKEGKDKKVSSFRHHIDLNSCISEDEASFIPSARSTNINITPEIDLEAPIVPETEDVLAGEESQEKLHQISLQPSQHEAEHPQDELIKIAAEAIVAISSSGHHSPLDNAVCNPSENSMADPLQWFVDVVSSCGDDLDSRFESVLRGKDGEDKRESSSESIDYFEAMTLNLTEIKEEDYLPKPLILENLKLEESGGTLLPNRPRRGQARRGRQRRDFQRDILPGLASLSRQEVTEDLQTFGGLMRATGHSWPSGLTRRNSTRNGCARGRRRSAVSSSPAVAASTVCLPLVQQLNNIEVGLEDRSLTGWGKTTRRPRRQRCPAGNPPSLALT